MKKTLLILIVVAVLGLLAAAVKPSSQQGGLSAPGTRSTASTTPPSSQSPSSSTVTTSSNANTNAQYKDGNYTGSLEMNRYDEIQVAVTIKNGRITSITTPTLSGDSGRSTEINGYAAPQLTHQALAAQNSSIDGVSGASYTTESYISSLQSALDKARA